MLNSLIIMGIYHVIDIIYPIDDWAGDFFYTFAQIDKIEFFGEVCSCHFQFSIFNFQLNSYG